jgi:hypothetical protein
MSGHEAELIGTFLPTFYFSQLQRAKEQCLGLGYSSKPTKQGNGRAWSKGLGGAGKKGR